MYGFDKSPLDFVSFSCANIGSNDMGQFKYFIYTLLVIEVHYFAILNYFIGLYYTHMYYFGPEIVMQIKKKVFLIIPK